MVTQAFAARALAAPTMNERLDFERDGADWPNRAASTFRVAGGLRWHVQVMGQGPVLLLLHGTGASTHSFAGLMPLLAQRFTVVAPDLPGHAFTSTPENARLSLWAMAESVAALVREMAVQPVLVAGHSAGVAILMRMCIDGTIAPRGLVSINGAMLPLRGFAGQFFSPLAKLMVLNPLVPRLFAWRAADQAAVARVLRGTGTDPDPRSLSCYTRLFRNSGHVAGTLAMMARWDLPSLERDLARLTPPTLLVAGSGDMAVPADDAFRVAKLVPHARVEVMRGAGHLAHEERPEDVARLVTEFYETIEGAR